jgi:hypothetical protein
LEAQIAHFCLQKLHILPSTFVDLSKQDRAFIIASCLIRAENEKKQADKAKKKK